MSREMTAPLYTTLLRIDAHRVCVSSCFRRRRSRRRPRQRPVGNPIIEHLLRVRRLPLVDHVARTVHASKRQAVVREVTSVLPSATAEEAIVSLLAVGSQEGGFIEARATWPLDAFGHFFDADPIADEVEVALFLVDERWSF